MRYIKLFESKRSKYYEDIELALSEISDQLFVFIREESFPPTKGQGPRPSFKILIDMGVDLKFGPETSHKSFEYLYEKSKEITNAFGLINEFIQRMSDQISESKITFNGGIRTDRSHISYGQICKILDPSDSENVDLIDDFYESHDEEHLVLIELKLHR
jgi:hypothetical protein